MFVGSPKREIPQTEMRKKSPRCATAKDQYKEGLEPYGVTYLKTSKTALDVSGHLAAWTADFVIQAARLKYVTETDL